MAPWLIDPKVISIEYGDTQITNEKVFARFRDAIKNFQPIEISNENLGCDPQPGVQKTCTITYSLFMGYYHQYRQQSRTARESSTLDFSWTLVDMTWGLHNPDDRTTNNDRWAVVDRDAEDPDCARFVERPDVYRRIYDAVAAGRPFPVTCEFLGCDPAFGRAKTLRLLYVNREGRNVVLLRREGEECCV